MTDADHPENRRTAPRHLATFRVRLGYADMDAFLSGYAVNISKGGIYVPTKQPKPRGTEIRFEILLKDGAVAVSGAGRVAWSAPFDPADPTKRYGMGVQFNSIDTASDDVVRKALEWKAAHLPAREASREVCPEDSKDQAAAHPVPGPEPASPAPPPPEKAAGADPVTRTKQTGAAGKKASLSDVNDLLASLRGTTVPREKPAPAKPRPAAPAPAAATPNTSTREAMPRAASTV
ncbi:MAG: PilZ domain-containing protein, partial [Myxococcota bacterium]|nr:PilZ domain-containing protein [Myxococcota bacterium]